MNPMARRSGGACACREPARRPNYGRVRGGALHLPRHMREDTYQLPDVEPIILAGKPGSRCKPFLQVVKNDDAFASCNALADEIGPLNDPKKVFRLLEDALGDEVSEVFLVMTLDLHGRLKGMTETGRGEASSVMAPMIPTLRAALLSGGGGAIVAHVHPSGIEAEPSDADIETTEAFDEAFDVIGMPLIDHIVIGGDRRRRSFFSFAEAGLL